MDVSASRRDSGGSLPCSLGVSDYGFKQDFSYLIYFWLSGF